VKPILTYRPALLLAFLLSIQAAVTCRADDRWGAWPQAQDPTTIGIKVVQNLIDRQKLDLSHGLSYLETCAGFGAVRFAATVNNQDLLGKVIARYQGIITTDGTALLPKPAHVDQSVFGILPLELFRVTQDSKYRDLGLKYADAQFATLNPDGLSAENKYYLDEAYKIGVMQILAYRATQNASYADHAVAELTAFIDRNQQPDGLFFHGPEGKVYWGRGNGWMAAALSQVLIDLPANNPGRPKIMASYKAMMAALLKYQAPDGLWRQILNDDKAWEESSCTGYFIFAIAEGVNHGWLDAPTYAPAAKKAWLALCGQLDPNANVQNVGVLTEHSNDESYYLARPKQTGNLHGQFATIWAATALLGQTP
jgi:rhamnogalacturonyl hydrolase YesR